jgi:uncharacterized protein YcbX
MSTATGTQVGTVAQCWRYPVKSLQGLQVGDLAVGTAGVAGDRTYGLVDPSDGRILGAKRVGKLLEASADDERITLPDGTVVAVDDPAADAALSAWLGREVRLAQPEEGEQRSYQMTFDPPNDDADYFDIPSPAGTFLDLAAVHLVTTSTLEACAKARPDLDWDVRRFRPNLVVDADLAPFAEDAWAGRGLRIGGDGGAELAVIMPTVRCAMPLRAQPGLERQPALFQAMRELNTEHANHLGIYCGVRLGGPVTVGDPVMLVD